MSEHDFSFVCILCGYHSHILVLDANRKVAFSVSGICQFLKYYQLTHVLLCRPSMDLYLAWLVVGLPCGLIPGLDQGKHGAHIFIIGPLETSAKTAETVWVCTTSCFVIRGSKFRPCSNTNRQGARQSKHVVGS